MFSATSGLAGGVLCMLIGCGSGAAHREIDADVEELPAPQASPPKCESGDPDAPPEVRVIYRDVAGDTFEVEAMSEIPLIQPPQGGKVMFIGVRILNFASCNVVLHTALIDSETEDVISLEQRPVFLALADDGWLHPRTPQGISNYSNLPACPRANLLRSIDGQVYKLQINVLADGSPIFEHAADVVPVCGEANHFKKCQCECGMNYRLGDTCNSE